MLLLRKTFLALLLIILMALMTKYYGGPLAQHNVAEAIKALENPDEYKAVKLKGSGGSLNRIAHH